MAPKIVRGPLERYWIANLHLDAAIKRNCPLELGKWFDGFQRHPAFKRHNLTNGDDHQRRSDERGRQLRGSPGIDRAHRWRAVVAAPNLSSSILKAP